jgi:hypothetical protein
MGILVSSPRRFWEFFRLWAMLASRATDFVLMNQLITLVLDLVIFGSNYGEIVFSYHFLVILEARAVDFVLISQDMELIFI